MTETITVCRITIPDQGELACFWALFSAAGDVGRWEPEPTEYLRQRVNNQNISDEEKAFIGLAWGCLVLNHSGFGRLIAAFVSISTTSRTTPKTTFIPLPEYFSWPKILR
ncbi:hypothetical protein [Yersinia aldovae]|uniref:hypothetical protein n=1 Tax=Yersinia aldovae TaxID=29483 RepID=UPI0005ABFEBB|nr:hypothetical protein [Yersinia aldovae]